MPERHIHLVIDDLDHRALTAPRDAAGSRRAGIYDTFAAALADQGFLVLTFGYRGTEPHADPRRTQADILTWASDAAAALEALHAELDRTGSDAPITWLGHSLGGQILGFVDHSLVQQVILVATGHGYWRHNGQWAADGNARWVTDGTDTDTAWATVHVDDLADLIALAVAQAPAGSLLHAVAGASVNVEAIARTADAAAGGNGSAVPWLARDAERTLGSEFTEALALTQHVTAERALALGWTPRRRAIIEEYHQGSYAGPCN